MQPEEKINKIEDLISNTGIISYDPVCIRKKSNWSVVSNKYKFDELSFQPELFLDNMQNTSPKIEALLRKIEELDKKDMKNTGKLYKHFIFSDLKSSAYGAKMIASAFVSKKYNLGYTAKLKDAAREEYEKNKIDGIKDEDEDDESVEDEGEDGDGKNGANKPKKKKTSKQKKRYEKITLTSNNILKNTQQNNFYILSSTGVYDQPITVVLKKEMFQKFNQRPDNINGELVRFIILDSGYKEGIDRSFNPYKY